MEQPYIHAHTGSTKWTGIEKEHMRLGGKSGIVRVLEELTGEGGTMYLIKEDFIHVRNSQLVLKDESYKFHFGGIR